MTKTKTKCIEDPRYAIFSKSKEFKDIKYDQTRPDQDRSGQRREESNLADLILELTFLLFFGRLIQAFDCITNSSLKHLNSYPLSFTLPQGNCM